jgi:general secretion pathway protein D
VQDGDTVSIGGIIQESDTNSSAGIPLLHRIPFLGAVFGSKSVTKARTELIVFLTPRVIYDTNQIAEASEEMKLKLKGLQRLIKE